MLLLFLSSPNVSSIDTLRSRHSERTTNERIQKIVMKFMPSVSGQKMVVDNGRGQRGGSAALPSQTREDNAASYSLSSFHLDLPPLLPILIRESNGLQSLSKY